MPSSGGGAGTPISGGGGPGTGYPSVVAPLLSLESFRRILGYHPYHFWGLTNSLVPVTSACNTIVRQHAWQDVDAAGREQVAEAIITAENRLVEALGYSVAPRYTEDTVPWAKYHNRRLWRLNSVNANGQRLGVRLPEGHIQGIGTERRTLLTTAAVTYSDADSDGLNDTFVVSVATAVTDPDEIAVYFAAADRLDGAAVSEYWRISPVSVTISGGTASIKGRSWLLVKPIKYEGVGTSGALDPSTAGNFVTTLEIHQRTTYTEGDDVDTSQAVLLWETDPGSCELCTGVDYTPTDSSNDPAAVGKAIARAGVRNAVSGEVIPGMSVLNATTGIWTSVDWNCYREPDRVLVRYLAGYPLDANGQMKSSFQVIVARLAAAELGRRICACGEANQELWHWQFDLARAGGVNSEQYSISPADLDNPWGTRRGQVYAWKQVRNLRLQHGLALN